MEFQCRHRQRCIEERDRENGSHQAQSENTSGYFNTAIGNLALSDNVTGDDNVAVGWGSGTTASFTNTISIGNYGYLNAFSDQAFIGNLSTTWNGGNVTWSTFSRMHA
ncbi:MAG: hypothetical protein R2815_11380 [Flavobacteriales bacterium]